MKCVYQLLYAFITFATVSCSTTNRATEKTQIKDFCHDRQAKEKYVFILSTYHSVPRGTPINQVNSIVTSSNDTAEFIRDNFIKALLAYSYKADATVMENEIFVEVFVNRFKSGFGPYLPNLSWVKDNRFAVCDSATCSGMKYPGSNDIVAFESQGYEDGRCENFFLPDGYVNGLGCNGGNPNGLLSYLKHSGFNAGAIVSQVYLVPSQSGKNKLCTKSKLNEDCFDLLRDREKFDAFTAQLSNSDKLSSRFPYFRYIQNFPDSDYARMKAESMFALDLSIIAGTEISTKVNNEWTTYRITWDPTPFCEFGRPNDDFVTH